MDAKRYQSLRDEMQAYINHGMKKHKITGMSIALVDGENVVWAQGFGYADKQSGRRVDANTIFKAGSITKVFTGTAIMQLVEQGKLDLDAPIQAYVPELKPKYHTPTNKPITLRSIMSHTSGLPVDALHGMFNRHPEPFARAIDYLNEMYAAYEPGTIATYSNLATDLLGVIIERASGQSYADYMQTHLLEPAGMDGSTLDDARVDTSRLSLTYLKHRFNEEYPLRSLPAGNLHSTALDMAKFISIILKQGQPLISEAGFREMSRVQTANSYYDSGEVIGLNWFLDRPKLRYLGPVLWHNGGTINFMSNLVVLPEQGLGVVIFSNSALSIGFVDEMADRILQAAAQTKNRIHPATAGKEVGFIKPPAETIREITGTYASLLGPVRIIANGNQLNAKLAGTKLQLRYQNDGWFSLRYRLFGLFPIPVKSLAKLRIRSRNMDGQRILQAEQDGAVYLAGTSYQTAPLSDGWRALLGKYHVEYPQGDYHWVSHVLLRQRDGFLVLEAKYGKLGTLALTLNPVSDNMAIIAGLGRGLQETITVNHNSGAAVLSFSGYRIHKQ